jgi:hypothetical protein
MTALCGSRTGKSYGWNGMSLVQVTLGLPQTAGCFGVRGRLFWARVEKLKINKMATAATASPADDRTLLDSIIGVLS